MSDREELISEITAALPKAKKELLLEIRTLLVEKRVLRPSMTHDLDEVSALAACSGLSLRTQQRRRVETMMTPHTVPRKRPTQHLPSKMDFCHSCFSPSTDCPDNDCPFYLWCRKRSKRICKYTLEQMVLRD
jgi:hypothetical protein